jgi:hypothetical protein
MYILGLVILDMMSCILSGETKDEGEFICDTYD